MELTGKTAFITGGVSGIGFGIARALCAAGAGLVLSYRNETVWEFKRELAGEGVYSEGSYPFELLVPSDIFRAEAAPPPGLLGDIARAVSFLQPQKRFPLQWHVFAAVSRPFRVDVKKKVDIVVTERPAGA